MADNREDSQGRGQESPAHPVLDYRHRRAYNRDASALLFPSAFHAFATTDGTLSTLIAAIPGARDETGHAHVGLLPFLMLLQRQSRMAFDLLAEGQAYQAWMLFRPGLEAGLIVGKWLDDPHNADVWEHRKDDPKAYKAAYWGKGLVTATLPRSEDLRAVLSRLNDDFMHPNPDYVWRHMTMEDAGQDLALWCNYFDDQLSTEMHLYSFLHVYLVLIDALVAAIGAKLASVRAIDCHLDEFERAFRGRVDALRQAHTERAHLLADLGLWSVAAPSDDAVAEGDPPE